MIRRSILVVCVTLVLGFAGNTEAARWIVPAAAHVTGAAGTNWRTDLRLVNPTEFEASVRVYLLEAGEDNSLLDVSKVYVVPALGQVLVADVLAGGFAFDGTAALLIESEEERLVATTRTYNLIPDGSTYGQFIPAVALDDALAAGEEGQIVHLAKSPDFRSNLGFAATTADAGRVTVELYDAEGVLRGSTERDFSGFEHFQFNDVFGAAGAPPAAVARAVIRTSAPIVAYGSVVDQGTGDPVAIMFQRLADAATELAITAAARAPGAQGSVWRSDLRIFNPGESAATVEVSYHQKGMAGGPRPSTTLMVDAGRILAVDDFMLNGLGLTAANGGLRISSDLPILVWSRTFNQADTGTFGQSIPAVPVASAVGTPSTHVFTGLSNVGFRSNVGFFEIADVSDELALTLRDGAGSTVGAGAVSLAAGVMDQINNVFGFLGAGGAAGDSYWLTVESRDGVIPYLSVSDNRSNDPVYEGGVATSGPCSLGLVVTADAYVRGGDFGDTPHGGAGNLLIKGVAGGTYARKIYLVFDLASAAAAGPFTTAHLKLTATRHVSTIPRDAVVSGIIDNDDWDPGALAETEITWNNAPRNDLVSGVAFLDQGATSNVGVRRLATVNLDSADPPNTAYLIDVTDFVRWAIGDNPGFSDRAPGGDSDRLVSLLVAHAEELAGYDGTEFASKENQVNGGCFQPQLIFE